MKILQIAEDNRNKNKRLSQQILSKMLKIKQSIQRLWKRARSSWSDERLKNFATILHEWNKSEYGSLSNWERNQLLCESVKKCHRLCKKIKEINYIIEVKDNSKLCKKTHGLYKSVMMQLYRSLKKNSNITIEFQKSIYHSKLLQKNVNKIQRLHKRIKIIKYVYV